MGYNYLAYNPLKTTLEPPGDCKHGSLALRCSVEFSIFRVWDSGVWFEFRIVRMWVSIWGENMNHRVLRPLR